MNALVVVTWPAFSHVVAVNTQSISAAADVRIYEGYTQSHPKVTIAIGQ
jgi:hypothetical protein